MAALIDAADKSVGPDLKRYKNARANTDAMRTATTARFNAAKNSFTRAVSLIGAVGISAELIAFLAFAGTFVRESMEILQKAMDQQPNNDDFRAALASGTAYAATIAADSTAAADRFQTGLHNVATCIAATNFEGAAGVAEQTRADLQVIARNAGRAVYDVYLLSAPAKKYVGVVQDLYTDPTLRLRAATIGLTGKLPSLAGYNFLKDQQVVADIQAVTAPPPAQGLDAWFVLLDTAVRGANLLRDFAPTKTKKARAQAKWDDDDDDDDDNDNDLGGGYRHAPRLAPGVPPDEANSDNELYDDTDDDDAAPNAPAAGPAPAPPAAPPAGRPEGAKASPIFTENPALFRAASGINARPGLVTAQVLMAAMPALNGLAGDNKLRQFCRFATRDGGTNSEATATTRKLHDEFVLAFGPNQPQDEASIKRRADLLGKYYAHENYYCRVFKVRSASRTHRIQLEDMTGAATILYNFLVTDILAWLPQSVWADPWSENDIRYLVRRTEKDFCTIIRDRCRPGQDASRAKARAHGDAVPPYTVITSVVRDSVSYELGCAVQGIKVKQTTTHTAFAGRLHPKKSCSIMIQRDPFNAPGSTSSLSRRALSCNLTVSVALLVYRLRARLFSSALILLAVALTSLYGTRLISLSALTCFGLSNKRKPGRLP